MVFLLKKIVTPFLLPPGIFILLLLLSGISLLLKRRWAAGALTVFAGCLIWFSSIAPVSDALLKGLESGFSIPERPKGDVIILLGGGVYDEAPDLTGTGIPGEDMMGRIVTAVRLQRKFNIPVIISGGVVFKGKKAEAPIVKRFLIDLGVPQKSIIVEDKSRDTIENAKYTKEICERYKFRKPLLVTSAFHMKRSVLSFKKIAMDVTTVPANFRTWDNKTYGWEDYLPVSLQGTTIAIREYLGLLFYTFAY